jgi:hypothetical protein
MITHVRFDTNTLHYKKADTVRLEKEKKTGWSTMTGNKKYLSKSTVKSRTKNVQSPWILYSYVCSTGHSLPSMYIVPETFDHEPL